MLEKYTFGEQDHTDLSMYNCGIEDCEPLHHWGPGIRDHYILHIVTSGSGTFTSHDTTVRLDGGQAFLICPGEVVEYQADQETPWSYLWVGFQGLKAKTLCRHAGLSDRHPIIDLENLQPYHDMLRRMLLVSGSERTQDLRRTGLLYEFMALINEEPSRGRLETGETIQTEYLRQAIHYIATNFSRTLSIGGLANHVGLDRSYLYSLFRKYLNQTPKSYLTRFRMDKACELLSSPLTISEVACSVGYEDPLLFSKVFKKEKGITPSQFRAGQAKIRQS
jgi:AraC-like DNA-binding protein